MRATTLIVFFIVCSVAMAPSVRAQSPVDGKWEAKLKTQVGEQTITINLKGDGSKLTGTVAVGQASGTPIEDGKIEGDTISFKQNVDFGGAKTTLSYTGKVNRDQIMFIREPFRVEFTAKRVSADK